MVEKKIPRIIGKPDGWTPLTELEHFMTCPVCGVMFDMRKLGEAFGHMHDGKKIELTRPDKC